MNVRRKRLQALWLCLLICIVAPPSKAVAQQQWTPERSLDVRRLSDVSYSPDGSQILYGINSIDLSADAYLVEYIISDRDGESGRTILKPSAHISAAKWSPDGQSVAYISSETATANLWLVNVDGSDARQLTDLKQDVTSFRWAPDGHSIAFTMLDGEDGTPVIDSDVFAKNRLWVVRLDDDKHAGEVVNLTADRPFSVSGWTGPLVYDWSPDSGSIAFAYQERPGLQPMTEAQVATVDVRSKVLTRIDIGNDNWKYFPRYSPDGKWLAFVNAPGEFKWSFLWDIVIWSVEDGRAVTLPPSKNRFPFIWEWAPDSESLYYLENDRVTYSLYRMPIDGGSFTKVFGSPGDLSVPGLNTYLTSSFIDVSPDGTEFAYIGQTSDTPPEIYVSAVEEFSPIKVTRTNDEFLDVPTGKTELITFKSLDGTEVEALLSFPIDYQEERQYPLVVQIHGGPNAVDFNEYLPLMRYFATPSYLAKGYFVLRVNYRGTLGYGQKFREDLIGQFGILDYQDIMSGVDHVIDEGLVDPEQMFLIGQSNGGTLTGWIITQTDRFQSACPIAGETDYISLEGTNGYFQTSWYLGGSFIDHLQRFIDRSPIFHVKNVTPPTLIQGGLLDDNVPHTQLQEFYRALKRVGVDVRLVGYPGADHEYYRPDLYLRLLKSCLDFTVEHTKP